jgi:hypothetical protein
MGCFVRATLVFMIAHTLPDMGHLLKIEVMDGKS